MKHTAYEKQTNNFPEQIVYLDLKNHILKNIILFLLPLLSTAAAYLVIASYLANIIYTQMHIY